MRFGVAPPSGGSDAAGVPGSGAIAAATTAAAIAARPAKVKWRMRRVKPRPRGT